MGTLNLCQISGQSDHLILRKHQKCVENTQNGNFCQTPLLGLGLGVYFTFVWDNNDNNDKNPHLNFLKGTVLGDKDQGVGMRDKG